MASRVPHRVKGGTPADDQAPEQDDAILDQDMAEDERDQDLDEEPESEISDRAVASVRQRSVGGAATVTVTHWYDALPHWLPKGFRESLIELSKVTWPSRQEAINLTMLVIAFTVAFAIVFGLIDLGLVSLLSAFTTKFITK